jgi:hypothetical protein
VLTLGGTGTDCIPDSGTRTATEAVFNSRNSDSLVVLQAILVGPTDPLKCGGANNFVSISLTSPIGPEDSSPI